MSSKEVGEPWKQSRPRSGVSGTSTVGAKAAMKARSASESCASDHWRTASCSAVAVSLPVSDAGQQPGVGVAHHDRAGQLTQARHGLRGLRAALDRVAQADDLVYSRALDVRQGDVQRDTLP